MKIYFTPSWNQYTFNSAFYEEGEKYKIFVMEASHHLTFIENAITFLLVPHDTVLAQQIKEMIDKKEYYHIFATSAENLKFKQNFWVERSFRPNGLLIKDTSQVEKIIGEKSKPAEPEPQQITFKVVSQEKGKENQWGSYYHALQIEPLSLGIEELPKITQLEFDFTRPSQPTPGGGPRDPDIKLLSESELCRNPILENSVGKKFTMEIKTFMLDELTTLTIGGFSSGYVFNSLSEVKNQDNPETPPKTPPKNDNSNNSSPDHEPRKGFGTLKIVLIVSIIIVGLSFLAFIFYHFKKRRV